jgi:hypothetical protein
MRKIVFSMLARFWKGGKLVGVLDKMFLCGGLLRQNRNIHVSGGRYSPKPPN